MNVLEVMKNEGLLKDRHNHNPNSNPLALAALTLTVKTAILHTYPNPKDRHTTTL